MSERKWTRRVTSPGRKHGISVSSPEYRTFTFMLQRCYEPSHRSYPRYGGRGIKVCQRWLESVENFVKDMGKRPTLGHTLDRIDKDGDYSPENCKWATWEQQASNRSTAHLVTHAGLTLCIAEWARRVGISRQALQHRLATGRSVEEALSAKKFQPRPRQRKQASSS